MQWPIMWAWSDSLGLQIPSRLKWYVYVVCSLSTKVNFGQGELAHQALKVFYPLTSKLDTPAQLAKHERRCHILHRVTEAGGTSFSNNQSPANAPPLSFSGMHHHFASYKGSPINLFQFLQEHDGDPAIKVEMILQWELLNGWQNFMPKLKDHVLYQLQNLDISYCNHTFTDKEHNSVIIPNNIIYSIQTMQVYYTIYNLRCEHNTINPRTHADVMVVSGETTPTDPYWYACILGIYHMET